MEELLQLAIPLHERPPGHYCQAMLVWRLVLGTVFIGGIAALCWADYHSPEPGLWLLPLALALALLVSNELLTMMPAAGLKPAVWPVYVGSSAMVGANWIDRAALLSSGQNGFDWPATVFVIALLAVFAVEMARYREPGESTIRLATAVLAISYTGWLLTFLVRLRLLGGNRSGMAALLTLIIVVKMCDTGAYTVGRLIGRHKMTPRLSGGKTIEGLVGGLAFACFGSGCAFRWLLPAVGHITPTHANYAWWVYGLVVGLAGVLGDLAESLLKRDLKCKDSSTWMPGFGGVLDVLDSLLFSAPIAYLMWRWLV